MAIKSSKPKGLFLLIVLCMSVVSQAWAVGDICSAPSCCCEMMQGPAGNALSVVYRAPCSCAPETKDPCRLSEDTRIVHMVYTILSISKSHRVLGTTGDTNTVTPAFSTTGTVGTSTSDQSYSHLPPSKFIDYQCFLC